MFREVMGSLWWQERGLGLAFGPGGPEGPFGPLGWMLVFCVRIEVVGSASRGYGWFVVAEARVRVGLGLG